MLRVKFVFLFGVWLLSTTKKCAACEKKICMVEVVSGRMACPGL